MRTGNRLAQFVKIALQWLAQVEIGLVALMLLAALFISAYAIVARNLGYSTGDWALSLPEVLLVWMTFIGCGALVTKQEHVAADFLLLALPVRWRWIIMISALVLGVIVFSPLVWGAFVVCMKMANLGMHNSQIFYAPQALIVAGIPVGLALTLLHLLGEIFVSLMRMDSGGQKPEVDSVTNGSSKV